MAKLYYSLTKAMSDKAEEFLFDVFAIPWKYNCHRSFTF